MTQDTHSRSLWKSIRTNTIYGTVAVGLLLMLAVTFASLAYNAGLPTKWALRNALQAATVAYAGYAVLAGLAYLMAGASPKRYTVAIAILGIMTYPTLMVGKTIGMTYQFVQGRLIYAVQYDFFTAYTTVLGATAIEYVIGVGLAGVCVGLVTYLRTKVIETPEA